MAGPEPRTGMMATAVVLLLLSLMGAGAGFAVGAFLQPGAGAPKAVAEPAADSPKKADNAEGEAQPKEGAAQGGDEAADEEEAPAEAELNIVAIPPVLTTLAAPQGKWIRLEGAILARPASSKAPDLLAEQAGEQILAYLRTVKLEQLQGPSGYLALRDDLNETLRTLSNGEVQGLLIHGLLVE